MRSKGTAGLLVCALVAAALAPARATVDAGSASAASAPSTAPVAARVSVLTGGAMTVVRGNDSGSEPAAANTALLPGDAFSTSGAAMRAEIQFDGYTALRLSGVVHGSIAADDVRARRIEISSGLVALSLWRGEERNTEIVTPALTLRAHFAGNYRVEVAADGTTRITARSGQADAVVPEKTYALVAGQTLDARVWAGNVTVKVAPAIASDDFDTFNQSRDRALAAANDDAAHLPASLAGYDDLAGYGTWSNLAPYGDVWVPQQSDGWAPYRDGNWDYDTGYGWTWVGAEPWGWVPYHYGSWIYSNHLGWCWYPPPIGLTPVWAPGLVAFFGYGAGPFGYSGYGWVPLAPYEPYYPWYPYPYPYPYPYRYPPPPKQKGHPPPKMHPGVLAAYRNARNGGASTLGAQAWQGGLTARPVAIDPTHLTPVKLVEGPLPMVPPHAARERMQGKPVQLQAAAPAPLQPAVQIQPEWASEFERAATILNGFGPVPAHAGVPEMHGISVPGVHGPPALHQVSPPTLHQGSPPTLHQVSPPTVREAGPPTMHQAPPPTVHQPPTSVEPPVLSRPGGSRPPA